MKLRLGRIERYVLIQQMKSLGVALAVIAALVMLIDFVEVSRGPGSSADLSAFQTLGLVLLKSPAVIVTLLPFVFLFGTLFAYVRLNRRSELIALRAAGVSAWRFVLPAAGMAVAMGMVAVAALSPLAVHLLASIGERPGLSVADSLGAYLTLAPRPGLRDSARNCVSNIHLRGGLSHEEAADRLAWLVAAAQRTGATGVALKDESGTGGFTLERGP